MNYWPKTVILLWLILATFHRPSPVWADGPARLYLQNVPLQDERLIVVNVQLENVTDLYGAELQLQYDPAQLRVRDDNPRLEGVQITPGPLLAFDDRFVATNQVDTQAGSIDFVFTLLRPTPPISGQGVLATVVFEIAGDGPFTVEVSQAQLVSAVSQSLPVVTENLQLNGQQSPVAAPPPEVVSVVPVWVWWGSLGLLVVLGGGLLLLARMRLKQAAPIAAKPTSASARRHRSGRGRSAAQSAALLTRQGNHLLEQGNLESAYELFNQAIELDPGNVEAWLGKGLVAQQEVERSICFQRVLALDPDNEVAKRELQQ